MPPSAEGRSVNVGLGQAFNRVGIAGKKGSLVLCMGAGR
jgi:hypothetical protein